MESTVLEESGLIIVKRSARPRPPNSDEVTSTWDAYAIWVGVGAVGTAIIGIAVLGESASALRIVSPGRIVAGIIGLQLVAP
jgi:hypothetical protein